MNHDHIWRNLIADARAVRAERGRGQDPSAPFGFATRVLARVREVRESERRLVLWQRVAWRAALASVVLCGVVFLSQRSAERSDGALLVPPTIEWPLE